MCVKKKHPHNVALDRWGKMAAALSDGDKDLLQELLIEICSTVDRFNLITDGLVKIRLLRRRLIYWRGSGVSLDNGARTRRQHVYRTQDDSSDLASDTTWLDPEAEVLFRITCEQVLHILTTQERAYWFARLKGMTWRDIEQAGIADRNKQPVIKARLRSIFRRHFGV